MISFSDSMIRAESSTACCVCPSHLDGKCCLNFIFRGRGFNHGKGGKTLASGLTLEPCLPRPAKEPPGGAGWIHEIKHDGFRIIARRPGASGCSPA